MHAQRPMALGVLCGVTILGLTACSFLLPSLPGSRTNDQGGGPLLTGYSKVSQGSMTTLTPDEVQLLTDYLISQGQIQGFGPLTNEQAAAVVTFLRDNNINSLDDFNNLDPNTIVISDEVRQVIEAMTGVNLDEYL